MRNAEIFGEISGDAVDAVATTVLSVKALIQVVKSKSKLRVTEIGL